MSSRDGGAVGHFLADPVVAEINERTGSGLQFLRMADGGASGGAAYVQWPDGRVGVLTRPHASVARMRLTGEILALARSHGLPVPRHDLVVELANGSAAVVQERLPGEPTRVVDVAAIDALIAMNERFADLLSDRPDVPIPPLNLRPSAPPHPGQELLRRHSDRTRRVLHCLHEIADSDPGELVGDDILHIDYARGNVLWDDRQRITGVIDWNLGIARGDRRFALVGLRRDLEWSVLWPEGESGVDLDAIEHLDDILEDMIAPAVLRKYWAHWTLSMLHGLIPGGTPEWIDVFLKLGESRLGLN